MGGGLRRIFEWGFFGCMLKVVVDWYVIETPHRAGRAGPPSRVFTFTSSSYFLTTTTTTTTANTSNAQQFSYKPAVLYLNQHGIPSLFTFSSLTTYSFQRGWASCEHQLHRAINITVAPFYNDIHITIFFL